MPVGFPTGIILVNISNCCIFPNGDIISFIFMITFPMGFFNAGIIFWTFMMEFGPLFCLFWSLKGTWTWLHLVFCSQSSSAGAASLSHFCFISLFHFSFCISASLLFHLLLSSSPLLSLLIQTQCSPALSSPHINPCLPSSVPHNWNPRGSYIFLHLDTARVTYQTCSLKNKLFLKLRPPNIRSASQELPAPQRLKLIQNDPVTQVPRPETFLSGFLPKL